MGRRPDVILRKDGDFDIFQAKLIADCTANAVAWNIDAAKLAATAAKQGAWNTAWAAQKKKSTRNKVTKKAKDDSRKKYEQKLRPFIKTEIRGNDLISAGALAAMNIKPIDNVRTR